MKISLGTWSFAFGPYADDPIPLERVAERVAEVGYDGVELSGFPPHASLEDYPTKESRRELVTMLGDLNLGVSGYSADLTSVNPTVAGNAARYLDLFRRTVDLCADIKAPLIRVDTVSAPGSVEEGDYPAALSRVAAIWHEAAGIADKAGVRLVWEFEPGFVFNKLSEVIAIHDEVAHPNFGLVFDTAHAYMCSVVGARQHGKQEKLKGGVPEMLTKLKGRIRHVHVDDSDGTLYVDETSTHCPLGEGKIDFAATTPALLAIPEVDWWCIDHCFWAGSWELVEPSLRFVRGLLET